MNKGAIQAGERRRYAAGSVEPVLRWFESKKRSES